jgi:F-type H+-transporting ATPase subunit b
MEKLGIDPFLIGAQIINFLLLLYVLKRFLYKPVLNILKRREEQAEEIDALKKELETQKDQFKQEHQEILKTARKEADQIISEAQVRGEKIEQEIEKSAKEKSAEILEKTNQELSRKEQEIRDSLKNEVSQLALDVSEKVMLAKITKEQKDDITDQVVKRFVKHESE